MFESKNFYDILEIQVNATSQEIRAAYLKLKDAYSKDSVALHGLMGVLDTTEVIKEVEEAYRTLSDPDRKKKYDENFESADEWKGESSESLFIPPTMPVESFDHNSQVQEESIGPPAPVFSLRPPSVETASIIPPAFEAPAPAATPKAPSYEHQTEWRGDLIKQARESKGVSLVDLASKTRISKTYLNAIENEDHAKLPAVVFLRGFLIQIARELRLPQEIVARSYLARLRTARGDQTA